MMQKYYIWSVIKKKRVAKVCYPNALWVNDTKIELLNEMLF